MNMLLQKSFVVGTGAAVTFVTMAVGAGVGTLIPGFGTTMGLAAGAAVSNILAPIAATAVDKYLEQRNQLVLPVSQSAIVSVSDNKNSFFTQSATEKVQDNATDISLQFSQ
ncbi:MAG: hypothetical protein Tsb005_18960 [Gammaproteobacteria bacterium]